MKRFTRLLFFLILGILAFENLAIAENTECTGSATESTQGDNFTNGYNYTFTTVGTDVTVTFELLDTKIGLVAYLWNRTSGFAELGMTNTTGQQFSYTLTGQTLGSTITVACKFAYAGGMAVTKDFTYTVGNSCGGGTTDTESPSNFTASKGTVTFNSVELLLNATDNSGAVIYEITYGSTTLTTSGSSGVEKSYKVTGLIAETAYTFSILAKDAANNTASNSPITVNATTTANTNTECAGSTTEAAEGSFSSGYNYSFTTSGTDVTVTFELLDTKTGLIAYLFDKTSGFMEHAMSNSSGQIFSYTLTGQTIGVAKTFACKFAFAGGLAITKDFTYTVGNSCTSDIEIPTAFTATLGTVSANSVELLLNATDNSGAITYEITYGSTNLSTGGESGVQKSYVVSGLTASTNYSFSITAKDLAGNTAANSPIVVIATTSALAEPTEAAPTPPAYSAGKVISIFSDAFTSVAGTNFNPNWNQSTTVSTIQIQGNNTLKYANLNYQGTEFGNDVNAVAMNYLHVDVWTPNETSLNFYLISRTTGEKYVSLTPLNINNWNSYDIPLTSFTDQSLSIEDVFQFKIVGSGGKVIYLDNMYFYNNSTDTDTEAPTAFTASAGAKTYSSIELLLNATDNSGAVTYEISYSTTTLSTTGTSGTEKSYKVTGLTPSTEYTFSIVAKDITGNQSANSPLIVTASTVAAPASPSVAAPVPTANASTVISIYSDTYTNVSDANYNPNWGQSTIFSTFDISGNASIKLENFNYQGFEFSTVDASTMNKLHIDVWTPNETSLQVSPISPGKELLVALTPLSLETWNSFDIPLSSFTGVSMSNLYQFKLVGSGGKIIYIDNVYLYNDTNNAVPNVSSSTSVKCYPNPVINSLSISANSKISTVEIHNLLGQIVKTVKINGTEDSINLNNLQTGNYIITFLMENGTISTRKIVKL